MTKIQLVHPSNDPLYSHIRTGYQSYPPPSGLEILASYVKRYCTDISIEVFDGNNTAFLDIAKRLDADVIGITDLFTSHNNAMELAKVANNNNPDAIVVIGGPNASNLGERILHNHPYVDYVVYGDGEQALLKIILREDHERIPNLWYRDASNEPKFTFTSGVNLIDNPFFDFEDLVETDIEKYDSRSPSYHNSIDVTPVPISSIRGCIKAVKEDLCSYCSIPMHGVRVMRPDLVWLQIDFLNKRYGIRNFFETGDNFTVGIYPEKLLKAKPPNLDVTFRIYAIPETITNDNVTVLKQVGVEEIFIGIESIDQNILRLANKHYDVSTIEKTVRLLKQHNIRVFLPFLFGLPGETVKSLTENYKFAQYLISKYDNVQRILLSLAIPLVGTPWFNSLISDSEIKNNYDYCNNGHRRDLHTDDQIEYERLFILSLLKFSSVDFKSIYNVLKKPLPGHLNGRVGGFGCLEDRVLDLEKDILSQIN